MRRPRKAAVDAHIAGNALPRFEDADWEDLERIARVPLDDVARTAIQDAASRYTEETLLQRDGAARAKMLGRPPAGRKQHKKLLPLEMFRKAIRQLVSAWNDADGDPETARLLADFAAVAAELGFSELTIAGLLGHSMPGVTARYAHVPDSALVAAADRVASRIAATLDGKESSNVLPLRAPQNA